MSETSLIAALGYLQEIIKRMAANSLFLKGWSMSLTGVILAVSKKESGNDYLTQLWLLIIFLNILFSILDAYYLKQERLFRNEYNNKVSGISDLNVKQNLTIISTENVNANMLNAYISISVLPFYSSLIIFSYLIARGCLQ
ncbi:MULTISPECIES: hypothetical protein [Erwiniaceae]|uniref:hypothetical protein n=1 Tax=Erwiniaceae TaxID=1903409 RepID=UPI0024BBBC9E|nr:MULTISPECIES: hypothetical protein [Erwiniaceae]MDN4629714.1 hypothetical protein [Erwinia sp. PsM31]WHQ76483.1 hypothetical protein PU624_09540 [Pantoea sp. Lij88]